MASSLIGQLRIMLGLETAQLETGTARAKEHLSGLQHAAEGVKKAIELIGIGFATRELYEFAKGALEFAASLSVTANRVGVTVEQLQVMRKAARENGIETEAMETGLARLNLRLGQAKAGLPAAAKAFKDIGITKEQLASYHSAGDALPAVVEGLHNVGDKSTQAAAAQELLSKAAIRALPVFTMGKEALDELTAAALQHGLITTEQAHRAHEAEVAVSELAVALKTRLAIAIADNIDEITSFITSLEHMVAKIADAIYYLKIARVEMNKFTEAGQNTRDRLLVVSGQITYDEFTHRQAEHKRQFNHLDYDKRDLQYTHNIPSARAMFPELFKNESTSPPNTLDLSTHHKPRKHADHTEQREKEAERIKYELDKEELDGQKSLLEAQRSLTIDTEERDAISAQILQVEHDLKALEIAHKLKMIELDRTISPAQKQAARLEAANATALNDKKLVLDRQVLNLQAELAREREYEQTQGVIVQGQMDKLNLERDLALTQEERRKVELEILELAHQEKVARLKRVMEEQYQGQYTHTIDDRNRALIELTAEKANYGSQREKVLRGTRGPLEELNASIPTTAARLNEALQQVAADGLKNMTDGLAEASASWIKLGGVAGNILRQIYADMMKLLLMKYIEKPAVDFLSSFLGSGSGLSAGQGSALDAVFGSIGGGGGLPGFATGGSLVIGGMAGVDQNLLSINGSPTARVGKGERIDIVPANDRGQGGSVFQIHIDAKGAEIGVEQKIATAIVEAAPHIIKAAHRQTMGSLTRRGING